MCPHGSLQSILLFSTISCRGVVNFMSTFDFCVDIKTQLHTEFCNETEKWCLTTENTPLFVWKRSSNVAWIDGAACEPSPCTPDTAAFKLLQIRFFYIRLFQARPPPSCQNLVKQRGEFWHEIPGSGTRFGPIPSKKVKFFRMRRAFPL